MSSTTETQPTDEHGRGGRPRRRAGRRWTTVVALALACCLVAAACGDDDGVSSDATASSSGTAPVTSAAGEPAEDEIDPDGVVRIALYLTEVSFDPATMNSANDLMTHAVYGSLLQRTEDGYEPGFATEATIVDASTIDLELRDGVVFSDGTPLDAEAVKLNLERNATLDNARGMRMELLSALDRVEVTGPLSARIHLKRPVVGVFYPLLADPETTIVSPKAIADGVDLNANPVGAGAFLLESAEVDRRVVLVPNPDYWAADQVKVAKVEFLALPPGPTAVNALRSGQVDWAVLTPSLAEGVGDPLVTEFLPHPGMYIVLMCKAKPPLDDVRVREAMMYAMDRDAIAQRVYGGQSEVAQSLRRTGDRYHNAELEGLYERDLDKARQLLAEAGYADGFEVGMYVSGSGANPVVGELLQAQWAEIGIDLSLQVSTNPYVDFFIENRLPLFPTTKTRLGLDNWTEAVMPGALSNICKYEHADTIAAAEAAMAADPDSPAAVEAWKELSAQVFQDLPFLPMMFHGEVISYNGERIGGVEYWRNTYANNVPRLDRIYVKA